MATEILARSLITGDTIQVGRIRGKIAFLAFSQGPYGTCGVVMPMLKNGRKLILDGAFMIKVIRDF